MKSPSRDTVDTALPANGGAKKESVDLGLALLEVVAKPGVTLTNRDIAAWCGCTDSYIFLLQKRAIRKLANRLSFGRERGMFQELFTEGNEGNGGRK